MVLKLPSYKTALWKSGSSKCGYCVSFPEQSWRFLLIITANKLTMMTVLSFSNINVIIKYADPGDFYFKSLYKLGHSYCWVVRIYTYIQIHIFPHKREVIPKWMASRVTLYHLLSEHCSSYEIWKESNLFSDRNCLLQWTRETEARAFWRVFIPTTNKMQVWVEPHSYEVHPQLVEES